MPFLNCIACIHLHVGQSLGQIICPTATCNCTATCLTFLCMLFILLFMILLTMYIYKVDCGQPVAVDPPVRLAGFWLRCHRMSAAFKSAFPVQGSWIMCSSVAGRFALRATGHRVVLLSQLACIVKYLLQ